MSFITLVSSIVFFIVGFDSRILVWILAHRKPVIGIATMFSSTIIGIKLLPTTILHHQHTGELVVSVLLLQDILAIAAIFGVEVLRRSCRLDSSFRLDHQCISNFIGRCLLFQRYVLSQLLETFDKIHEYIFILSIGWCLCMAQLSHFFGLSEK